MISRAGADADFVLVIFEKGQESNAVSLEICHFINTYLPFFKVHIIL